MQRIKILMSICLLFLAAHAADPKSKTDDYIKDFNALYSRTTDPDARRNQCIKAINDGVIAVFEPVTIVDRMFNLRDHGASIERSANFRRIHFEALVPGMNDANDMYSSGHYPGWYLYVDVDENGNIAAYYLSNVPKMTFSAHRKAKP